MDSDVGRNLNPVVTRVGGGGGGGGGGENEKKKRKKKKKKSNNNKSSPEDSKNNTVIADFGCGDAKIAKTLNHLPLFTVHSFDLVSNNPLVTAADMARTPLPDSSIDVAVYSLALMGVNILDFCRECWRVLRMGGVVIIAEVRSRFESNSRSSSDGKSSNNVDKNLLNEFFSLMKSLGFAKVKVDNRNKMFILMEFKKEGGGSKFEGKDGSEKYKNFSANPCVYKRR